MYKLCVMCPFHTLTLKTEIATPAHFICHTKLLKQVSPSAQESPQKDDVIVARLEVGRQSGQRQRGQGGRQRGRGGAVHGEVCSALAGFQQQHLRI